MPPTTSNLADYSMNNSYVNLSVAEVNFHGEGTEDTSQNEDSPVLHSQESDVYDDIIPFQDHAILENYVHNRRASVRYEFSQSMDEVSEIHRMTV